MIALHNVMFDGTQPQERFAGQVGTITATPAKVDEFVGNATSGSFPVTVKSSLPLAGLSVDAFGLGVPVKYTGTQVQDDPDDPSSASNKYDVSVTHGSLLEATLTSAAGDLDMFLAFDFNNDGAFSTSEVIASSTTSTANEFIQVKMPRDGNYQVWVQGWAAAPGTPFELVVNAIQGGDLTVGAVPSGPFQPNQPITFDVNWTKTIPAGAEAFGLIVAGPPGAPGALQIPVRLHNKATMTETVRLPAVADATLFKGMPTTNYGADQYIYLGGSDINRGVVKFDLSSLAVYPITSAKLKIYYDAFSGGGSAANLNAYNASKAWAEGTATWNAPWAVPGGDFVAGAVTQPITGAEAGSWKVFDVTAWAQAWAADAASNNGVLLRVTDQASFTVFRVDSREMWNAAQRPVLEVVYQVP